MFITNKLHGIYLITKWVKGQIFDRWFVNQYVFKYPQCVMRTHPLTAVLLRYVSQSENA